MFEPAMHVGAPPLFFSMGKLSVIYFQCVSFSSPPETLQKVHFSDVIFLLFRLFWRLRAQAV